MKKNIFFVVGLSVLCLAFAACGQAHQNEQEVNDTTVASEEPVAELVGNDSLNQLAAFFAGKELDSTSYLHKYTQTAQYQAYAQEMRRLWGGSMDNYCKVDSFAQQELNNIRKNAKTVLYSFGGADFIYPTCLFPEAENYYLIGLENAGTPLKESTISAETYQKYLHAFRFILRHSYFITKDMLIDFNDKDIDGTMPIMMIMMSQMDREIIGVEYKTLSPEGDLVDSEKPGKITQINFFKKGSNKEQHITFISANVYNPHIDSALCKFLDKVDYQHTVACQKAASYLMHNNGFSTIRSYVLRSAAIVTDDSGLPLRAFKEGEWDLTLYGRYVHPIKDFGEECYQADMQQAFATREVKPLNFRWGYDSQTSLIVARKK